MVLKNHTFIFEHFMPGSNVFLLQSWPAPFYTDSLCDT